MLCAQQRNASKIFQSAFFLRNGADGETRTLAGHVPGVRKHLSLLSHIGLQNAESKLKATLSPAMAGRRGNLREAANLLV